MDVLELAPIGKRGLQTPSGHMTANTYLLEILLPNGITVPEVLVCDSEIGAQQIDVLIGMDIILLGDFAVSNYQGETTLTFRIPSQKKSDYMTELDC